MLCCTQLIHAATDKKELPLWSTAFDEPVELLEHPVMTFTNRARCSLESENPADKYLVILSHEHLGKALYRLGSRLEVEDKTAFIKGGIQEFQRTLTYLISDIHDRLLDGTLPLITDQMALHSSGRSLKKRMEDCLSKPGSRECRKLDDEIGVLWKRPQTITNNALGSPRLRCEHLKKFSPLEAQLYGTKPTKAALNAIAKAATQPEQYYQTCDEAFQSMNNVDLASSTFHMKLSHLPSNWKEKGYPYYVSLKLYLHYAFRHVIPRKLRDPRYTGVIQSLALEDMSFFFPSNCKSITPPACSEDYIAPQKMREFATTNFKKKVGQSDFILPFKENLTDEMLTEPTPTVNTDIMDFNTTQTAEEWSSRLVSQFSDVRLVMKRKLLSAINSFNVLMQALPAEDMNRLIQRQAAPLLLNEGPQISSDYENFLKQEMYYLCSEVTLVNHEYFSFVVKDLAHLRQTNNIDMLTGHLTSHKQEEIFNYYDSIADFVQKLCESKDQHKIWDDKFKLDKTGYAEWYNSKIYEGRVKTQLKQKRKEWKNFNAPILTQKIKLGGTNDICYSPFDCARLALSSIVDLYKVSKYQATFFPKKSISTPAAFNPYAERLACKVYDPWYKTQQTLVGFFSDIANAGMAYFTNTFLYANVDLMPGKVTSFKTMVEDGTIKYDPIKNPKELSAALSVDFGPLFGVPCSISISGPRLRQNSLYRYTGVTVGACHQSQKQDFNVYAASDIETEKPKKSNFCFDCQLNFESAASLVYGFGPVTSALYIVRAFVRLFKGLNDPDDVPRSWNLNLKHLLETYTKFGEVPQKCVGKLSQGKRCMLDPCEENILNQLDDYSVGLVSDIKMVNQRKYELSFSRCNKKVTVRNSAPQMDSVNGNRSNRMKKNRCIMQRVSVPRECR